MKTLIITGSEDITTDLLINNLETEDTFRFNTDLFFDYNVQISCDIGFYIKDLTGRVITLESCKKVYWRKPIWPEVDEEREIEDEYLKSEIKYVVQEIFNLARIERKAVLVDPFIDKRVGKLVQLKIAQKYFLTPKYEFSYPLVDTQQFDEDVIVKSFSSTQMKNNSFLYAISAKFKHLDLNSPWFIQEKILAASDVTVVYIGGKIFGYSLQRDWLSGDDWRLQLNDPRCRWEKFNLDSMTQEKIVHFMNELGLSFGRLDFLYSEKKLTFLEVNPNGQYAWLDFEGKNGMLKTILEVISPRTMLHANILI